ncbi:MAG: mandelate racemase/muconate lactonizing enzyme family protein [Rhodospirillaceae bacterium]|jgi:L-alanine-DL-glutamate epimerase-like enolase superfamily enzyme|nr:mandelate racemase/muconate lactonizing enzyme family protein [Rhodospirillaceae bacterium]MBT6136665.1 mandelate racemase/muconate lactonizing enzyme family protein [Rhodospirillaceae bacterium]
MKITRVEARRHRGDETAPYSAEIVIVRVFTDSEVTGMGFATAPPKVGSIFQQIIEEVLAPQILDADPRLTSDLWEKMQTQAIPRRGGDGIVRPCTAAIDMALWDIKGKAQGVPVSHLLGGHRDLVPTYANCAHHLPADALAERAASYVAKGHKALKIRGTRSFVTPAEATERVRQVREAIGPDVRLMVDVNGSWDVDTAIQQLKTWEPYDVYWLEEPVPPADIPGYARVRERSGQTYIVGGEQHVGLLEFRTLIEHGKVDIAQPNVSITGGITDWLRIHAYATARGVPISPWDLQMVHIHMAAGLANVQWIEYFMADNALLEFQTKLFAGVAAHEEVTEEGVFLRAPTDPGLGLALDEEVADRSLVQTKRNQ